jgi:phage baseplate assembly protein V
MSEAMIETIRESLATLRYGCVTAVDAAAARVRVRLPDLDDLETFWLPVLVPRTHRDRWEVMPDVGDHVALLLDARGETGVVLGALYSARDPAPGGASDITRVTFADGTVIGYDRTAHRVTATVRGAVTIVTDGPVTIESPRVTCTGEVVVDGRLTARGGMAISGGTGATATVTGPVEIQGSVRVQGDIEASGRVWDGAGNSPHHRH